jgi:hypothetical protein
MIDSETRLDRASIGSDGRFTYHHTLINHISTEIDATQLREALSPNIKAFVCSEDNMIKAMEYGVIYAYSYSGADGRKITELAIQKSDCL